MSRKLVLLMTLITTLNLVFNIRPIFSSCNEYIRTEPYIYIRPDGSVVQFHQMPPYYRDTTLIQRDGDTYTFTDNIYSGEHNRVIVVQRDNIVIDGAGYTVQGTGVYRSRGIDLTERSNVTIKNMKIEAFAFGIYLHYSSNITISGDNITKNSDCSYEIQSGIYLRDSSSNSISGNNIIANDYMGIYLLESSNNIISGNNIANNDWGIWLWLSSSNSIHGNSITNHSAGIELYGSSDNLIYHNNFINNIEQVAFWIGPPCENVWDNGVEGNYWSNYAGVDSNHDGIGDSPHDIVWSQDYYPLMGMFSSFNTSLDYYVNVISNSTIEDFQYFESNSTIKMHVSNMTANQTYGFCRIRIPHALMNETYHVTIDGAEPYYVNYTLHDDGDNRWIYFNYQHSTLEITITPEFPTWTSMLLILIMLTVATAIYKRRLLKQF